MSLSRLAVALLTVRRIVLLSTDWQLTRTTKRPLRSAERVSSRDDISCSATNAAGRGVDGACGVCGTFGAPSGVATVSVCDW